MTILASIDMIAICGNGTVAMIFLYLFTIGLCDKLRFNAHATMITDIATTIFGRCLTEWSTISFGTQTLHVFTDFLLRPNMPHRFGFIWIANPNDTETIILAIQSAIWDGTSLEFAMTTFPAVGTNAWIGFVGGKAWVAVAECEMI